MPKWVKETDMETAFGKWLKRKQSVMFLRLILVISTLYAGWRLGGALEEIFAANLHISIAVLFVLLFGLSFTQLAGNRNRPLRIGKVVSAYFLCFLVYDVPALLLVDLMALLLRPTPGAKAALILFAALLTGILLLYGSVHARNRKKVFYTVPLEGQNTHTRIVLLSDLHLGIFVGTAQLEKIVQEVNRESPDFVMITGDIFDGYLPAKKELSDIAALFRQLSAKEGVYAVSGNHDPDGTDRDFLQFFKEAHIHFLCNEALELPQWNVVGRTGIVDMEGVRVPLTDLLGQGCPQKPVIVLDHDPQGIREAAACGVDLVLCGHTHKGQFFPMTKLTKLANGPRYFYGYGPFGKTRSVISAGTGFFGLPIRIGTNSEIVVIDVGPRQPLEKQR